MTKKIQLKTNFSLQSRRSGAFELPPSVSTIAALLRHIGKEAGFVFIDAQGVTLRRDVEVLINGRDVSFLPSGLNTILSDGDSVDIALMTLGGG
jgi:molybdopterin converting factor small subunit